MFLDIGGAEMDDFFGSKPVTKDVVPRSTSEAKDVKTSKPPTPTVQTQKSVTPTTNDEKCDILVSLFMCFES